MHGAPAGDNSMQISSENGNADFQIFAKGNEEGQAPLLGQVNRSD
jgi:hypothetical protein